jgi:hypothetical protein
MTQNMLKSALIIVVIFVGLFLGSHQTVFGQSEDKEWDAQETNILKGDYKQVAAVLYVDVKTFELIDSIGTGNCVDINGGGYCLYRLKAEVKEIFKGKIKKENFEFYTVLEASTGNKDFLLGEKIVFLNWSSNYPDKKRHLGTLENSTRSIKDGVLEKMRRIAKKKKN